MVPLNIHKVVFPLLDVDPMGKSEGKDATKMSGGDTKFGFKKSREGQEWRALGAILKKMCPLC